MLPWVEYFFSYSSLLWLSQNVLEFLVLVCRSPYWLYWMWRRYNYVTCWICITWYARDDLYGTLFSYYCYCSVLCIICKGSICKDCDKSFTALVSFSLDSPMSHSYINRAYNMCECCGVKYIYSAHHGTGWLYRDALLYLSVTEESACCSLHSSARHGVRNLISAITVACLWLPDVSATYDFSKLCLTSSSEKYCAINPCVPLATLYGAHC